jgi:hypothetical protein
LFILVLSLLLSETSLGIGSVTLVVSPVLDGHDVVVVLFRQHFPIMHWLNCGMKVVLVDLAISGNLTLLPLMWVDGLVLYTRCYTLMNLGVSTRGSEQFHIRSYLSVMLSRLRNEIGHRSFRFLHIESIFFVLDECSG